MRFRHGFLLTLSRFGETKIVCGTLADEMEIEDGAIGLHVFGEEGVAAPTEFGMDNLVEGRPDRQ
ncbi:hypothetical protein ACYCVF_31470 [Bradyrhizobium sp. 1.29L]